jgi:hypothetical protein
MSTVGDVKTALRVLWQSTFTADELRVTFGNRITVGAGHSRLVIGDVSGTTEPESLGPTRTVDEEYDIQCEISRTVQGSSADQEAVTLAVLQLFETAEHAVRASAGQNLGVTDVIWAGCTGGFDLKEASASETNGPINASFAFAVHVRARYRLT